MSSSILQHTKDCTLLSKQKEDEVTWSKIDTVFTKLKDELQTPEDCKIFIDQCSDLLIRSVLSERSKLSGTSLLLLKRIFDILKSDMENISNYLTAVLKLSGRTNKIVFTRAHDALVYICKYIDISPYVKIFAEYFESNNKNIRLGVVKAITSCKANGKLIKIIEKGKMDPNVEIRNICKSYKLEVKSEAPVKIEKKELSPQKIPCVDFLKPEIKHSPFKKMPKIDKFEETSPCNKITELEKQVKAITNIKKKAKPVQFKPPMKFVQQKKDLQDDLTPKKLDKYLSKYRTIYGNILEKKDEDVKSKENNEYFYDDMEMEGECNDKSEICDLSREVENISLIEESKMDTLKYEYTIMNLEKTILGENKLENEKIEEVIIDNKKGEELKDEMKIEDCKIDDNINEDCKIENAKVEEIKDDMKFDENILEEIKFENTGEKLKDMVDEILKERDATYNHEQSKIEDIIAEKEDAVVEKEHLEIVNEYERISEKAIKSTPKKQETPFKLNSASLAQNRFSSLLFADKEECVIYDINADSPLFKKSPNDENQKEEFLQKNKPVSSPKSVVNTAVSSSFLYSNDNSELNHSVDYTKIDSVIYVDKNVFNKSKEN